MKKFWKQLKENILYVSVGAALFVGFIAFTDQIKSGSVVGEWQCVATSLDLQKVKSKLRIHSHGTWHSTDVYSEVIEEEGILFPMEVGLKLSGTYKKLDDKFIYTPEEATITSLTIEGANASTTRDMQSYYEVLLPNAIGATGIATIITLDRQEWIYEEDEFITRCTRS